MRLLSIALLLMSAASAFGAEDALAEVNAARARRGLPPFVRDEALSAAAASCADHRGATWARIHTWNGSKWEFTSDWYEADQSIIKPMIKQAADKYAADKKLTRRTPEDCQS